MSKPYILYGWHLSFFSGKTRAYLLYKKVPFEDREVDALTLMRRIPQKTGATVMPVVVTPEGEWLQDTKHICDVLEQRFPDNPVLPPTPRQAFAAQLLELWADEWWIPPAMHYRWVYPENYALFEHDAGRALLPGFPKFMQKRIAAYVAGTLRGYLPSVGVVPEQYAVMERWTEDMLDVLEAHFARLPYLFGARPSIADFALLGPMYGHLNRDPMPKRTLIDPRPQLQAWVERMNAPPPEPLGDFLADDAIPDTLHPVFDAMFREFYPMLDGIRDEVLKFIPKLSPQRSRLPRALGPITFPMGAGGYQRQAMPYTLWMKQRIIDDYRSRTPEQRAAIDSWLETQGAAGVTRFDPGPRLRRKGLHVCLDTHG